MSLTAILPAVFKGRTQILHKMQIAVTAGQVLGVVGPNGAGKSTVLRSLAGVDALHAAWNGLQLPRSQIGYMPQAFQLSARLSVLEAVLLGKRESLGWRVAAADLVAAGLVLTDLGLAHLEGRTMDRLSGGEQQMVLLAQRILRAPRLLILDEPTSALDLHHQLVILRHLKAFASANNAVVVLALHDLTLAARFCDQLLLIDHGSKVAMGDAETVLTAEHIEDAWDISPELLHARDGSCVVVPH